MTENVYGIIKAQSTNRMDVFVRCMYAEASLKEEKFSRKVLASNLYCKMQHARMGKEWDSKPKFDCLIDSIKKNGFKEESKILLDYPPTKQLLDGSHRLSCCLAFNFNNVPVEYDEGKIWGSTIPKNYGLDWFKSHEFSQEEINLIENFYNKKIKELDV